MMELEAENCQLRNLLTLATYEEQDVEKILQESEQRDIQMRYEAERRKQQEWDQELQRLRDEISGKLEKRYEQRVIDLEIFFQQRTVKFEHETKLALLEQSLSKFKNKDD